MASNPEAYRKRVVNTAAEILEMAYEANIRYNADASFEGVSGGHLVAGVMAVLATQHESMNTLIQELLIILADRGQLP